MIVKPSDRDWLFALESNGDEIASLMNEFLAKYISPEALISVAIMVAYVYSTADDARRLRDKGPWSINGDEL